MISCGVLAKRKRVCTSLKPAPRASTASARNASRVSLALLARNETAAEQRDAAAWYDWVHMLNGAVFVTGKEAGPSAAAQL